MSASRPGCLAQRLLAHLGIYEVKCTFMRAKLICEAGQITLPATPVCSDNDPNANISHAGQFFELASNTTKGAFSNGSGILRTRFLRTTAPRYLLWLDTHWYMPMHTDSHSVQTDMRLPVWEPLNGSELSSVHWSPTSVLSATHDASSSGQFWSVDEQTMMPLLPIARS